jgi:3-phenylpropionate/trans-cinnamate dioxygenase ferredoxin reductase subunit
MSQGTVAIIGAGQSGYQVATSLREQGYAGRVVIIGEEPHAPYQRPPLSKAYLSGNAGPESVALCPQKFYAERHVELITGKRVVAIDRTHRKIALDDDQVIEYEHLVLATGARNRPLPVLGADLEGVCFLRTVDEATAVRARLSSAKTAVVIGAGFIGLEFAASAVKMGLSVTVLDVAERPMARALSKSMSDVFSREHDKLGVKLLFNTQVKHIRGEAGRVTGVETVEGQVFPADLVLIGIGVIPNVELAATCDLPVQNGIIVDEFMTTADPHISAVGDVAAHPSVYADGARIRLESVQNASDQARCVALHVVGKASPYVAFPWFWSTQGDLRLQIAGLLSAGCKEVIRGDVNSSNVAVFNFKDDKLVCVETLNRPADHMLGRKLLSQQLPITPVQAADLGFDLKTLVPKPVAPPAA